MEVGFKEMVMPFDQPSAGALEIKKSMFAGAGVPTPVNLYNPLGSEVIVAAGSAYAFDRFDQVIENTHGGQLGPPQSMNCSNPS